MSFEIGLFVKTILSNQQKVLKFELHVVVVRSSLRLFFFLLNSLLVFLLHSRSLLNTQQIKEKATAAESQRERTHNFRASLAKANKWQEMKKII